MGNDVMAISISATNIYKSIGFGLDTKKSTKKDECLIQRRFLKVD